MQLDRRCFLIGSLLALTPGSKVNAGAGTTEERAEFVSACRKTGGGFAIVLLSGTGRILREIPLTARAHDVAVDRASGRAVAFSRRPGFFAVSFTTHGHEEPTVFAPEPGRHFYGHGTFGDGGRLLFTTEHDIESGGGLIGIYDVEAGMNRVGEFASQGIGPHEAILLADGRTLAVANGGISTDPTTGREMIGLTSMAPSLAFIDVGTGDLLAKHTLPAVTSELSIRHLAATPAGEVWFGGQWQGNLEDSPELIGRASLDKPLRIVAASEETGVALKGYIGSVTMSGDGQTLAASAPRAGRIVYLDTATGTLTASTRLSDGSGIAGVGDNEFALSSGHGVIRLESPGNPPTTTVTVSGTEFDNHLRRLF
jgi:uncharacterized protein